MSTFASSPPLLTGRPSLSRGADDLGDLELDLRRFRAGELANRVPPRRATLMLDQLGRLIPMAAGYLVMIKISGWPVIAGAAAMAVGAASLLGSAFHDSVHISAAPKINMQEVVAFLAAGSVGFSKLWWRYKHVRLHHTYPGDPRYDPDIQFGPLARVTSAQQFRPTHKFQHIYIWVLLPFSTLAMLKPAELWQKRVFAQRGALDVAPSSARLIADKYSPFALFWAPIIFTWGAEGFILRYATFSLFVGAIVSITTQVQHNTELSCEGGNEAQRHPLAYQVFASADVRSNRLWWWMCGGANFHVVHHLAPSLSYLELPRVSERLEFLLDSHGYSYPAHRSLRAAVASHGRLLKAMSRNETLGGANNGK